MVDVALSLGGKPSRGVEELDDGTVVSGASPTELHEANRETIRDHVELGKLADGLGYDYVSAPELHFALQGTISPNPVLTGMALAEATDSTRLLPSVVPEWHDPVRLAERTSMLDVVSDGRVDVGFTRGLATKKGKLVEDYFGQYWGGTQLSDAEQSELFDEKFEIVLRAWTETFLSFDGRYHSVPAESKELDEADTYDLRRYLESSASSAAVTEYLSEVEDGSRTQQSLMVSPQPEQEPHPPLWTTITTERAARWAAHRGINGFGLTRSFGRLRELISVYYDAAEDAGWPDRTGEERPFDYGWDSERRRGVAANVTVFNTDVADEETVRRWKQGQKLIVYLVKRAFADDGTDVGPVSAETAIEEWDSPVFGSTDHVRSELRRLMESCGYEDVLLKVSFDTFGLSTSEKRTQIRSFKRDVVPEF